MAVDCWERPPEAESGHDVMYNSIHHVGSIHVVKYGGKTKIDEINAHIYTSIVLFLDLVKEHLMLIYT